MKRKIRTVKFYNSIKSSAKGGSSTQLDYVDTMSPSYSMYDITVNDSMIIILNTSTNETTYTTVFNTVYFTLRD